MMLALILALLAQPASAKGPLHVRVPNGIVDLHDQYVLCQDDKFDVARVRDLADFRRETERAIDACASEKAFLAKAADARLARTPDHADPVMRRKAIAEAFDGYDRVRRAMAAGQGTPSR